MDNAHFKTIISWALLSSVFILGEGFELFGLTMRWYYLLYILVFIWGIFYYRKIDVKLILAFSFIIIYSVVTYNDDLSLVIKQWINITISCFVFYFFLVMEEFNIDNVFRKYISLAKIVLILGFIQVGLFSLGGGSLFLAIFPFLEGSNISYRFQSVSQEPSYIAYTFAPVVFLSLRNLVARSTYLIGKKWSLLFLTAYLLTFSLLAYIGLIMMVLLLVFKNYSLKKLVVSVFIFFGVAVFSWMSYTRIPLITIKVNETLKGISLDPTTDYKSYVSMNFSSFTFLTNLYVTNQSFKEHPFTGTGLGTYEVVYQKILPENLKKISQLNSRDAGSMAFRLLTEVGAVGFALFCFFLIKFRLRSRRYYLAHQDLYWILNAGILVMIVLELIRDGNYTNHGKFLFLLLYYYTCSFVRKELRSPVNEPTGVAS